MPTATSAFDGQVAFATARDLGGLSDSELLSRLGSDADRLTKEAFDEVVRRLERLAPALEAIVRDDDLWNSAGDDWWACVHATFALSAGGRLADVASLIEAVRRAARAGVDWLTDPAGELFLPFGRDCWDPLEAVVEDDEEGSYARILCLSALVSCAVVQDQARRPTVLVLAANVACFEDADWDLREFAVEMLTEFAASGHAEDVEAVLDEHASELKEAVRSRAQHCSRPFAWCRRDPLVFYAPDAIARRQDRWERDAQCDATPSGQGSGFPLSSAGGTPLPAPPPAPPQVPFVRQAPKIGRNDPCPCGSGRKLKMCCRDV